MVLSEADIERYCTAIHWAQLPANKEHLPEEIKALLAMIEDRTAALKPKECKIYELEQTIKGPENKRIALTTSPSVYYIRG